MKTEEIKELFEQFESIANEYEGSSTLFFLLFDTRQQEKPMSRSF